MADGFDYTELGSYRLRVGTFGANQLGTAYEIAARTRTDDQPNIVDWLEPLERSDVYSDFIELDITMDGGGKILGEGSFTWYLSYMTPQMVAAFIAAFPGGLVTAMTFDAGEGWRVVNATQQPINKTEGQRVGTGYINIPVRFVAATEAESGFTFNDDFSLDFDAPG